MPGRAQAYAVAQPVRPPPTITTSAVCSPRSRGKSGRRLMGKVSIQGEMPYRVRIPLEHSALLSPQPHGCTWGPL